MKQRDPTIAFRVPQRLLEKIDRAAGAARRKRSEFLRLLVEDALSDSPSSDSTD